ncbi:CobW family GTP-binding protein [Cupriavidus necator]|uniref:CobW family GTP-binding protein n=1 Tax=Cupriavidus necator TaxID=106590 RepID=UPI00068944C0|nr:GTP-binding protein [Cupriavidus necator]
MEVPRDFFVLSGFLGSGKTTLLTGFLAMEDDGQTAVIVNDVGQVNIDGALIAVQSGVPMTTLSNGCVCCSLTNDLPYTIEALIVERQRAGGAPFTKVILECSGLSEPGGVLRSLGPLAALGMRVRVITTYGCDRPVRDDDFALAANQLCAAHVIVLTRLDLATMEQISEAVAFVQELGPMASLVMERGRGERSKAAFATENVGLPSPGRSERLIELRGNGHPRIGVFAIQWDERIDWPTLAAWLENAAGYLDSRLLRVKGLVLLTGADEPILIQGVGQHFDTPRRVPSQESGSSLVVLSRDTDLAEIEAIQPCLPVARYFMLQSPGAVNKVRLARPSLA